MHDINIKLRFLDLLVKDIYKSIDEEMCNVYRTYETDKLVRLAEMIIEFNRYGAYRFSSIIDLIEKLKKIEIPKDTMYEWVTKMKEQAMDDLINKLLDIHNLEIKDNKIQLRK